MDSVSEPTSPSQTDDVATELGAADLLHDSLLHQIFLNLDTRGKCAVVAACRQWREAAHNPELWSCIDFSTPQDQQVTVDQVVICLHRSKGRVRTLKFSKTCDAALEAQSIQRAANGIRCTHTIPFTLGLRAISLAALLPNLQQLSIDERTSCLGGMTDDFAKALSTHCPALVRLQVAFERHSLPSELFTDDGLIVLTEGCTRLQAVVLHGCSYVTDRSLYALAANCSDLRELHLGGYHERITDCGISAVLASCARLEALRVSSKLFKVTDASVGVLAQRCAALQQIKLSRGVSDEGLQVLASSACAAMLQDINLRKCTDLSPSAIKQLLLSCPQLRHCRLPASIQVLPDILSKERPAFSCCLDTKGLEVRVARDGLCA